MVRVRLRELDETAWRSCGLGLRTDREVARALMACQSDITRYRNLLGIPSAGHAAYADMPLGAVPARVLAERHGVDAGLIRSACRRRGLPAGPARFYTREGWPCRSYEEAVMDMILHQFGVPHEHEVKLPVGRYRADFHLTAEGRYLEVAGMLSDARYRRQHDRKRADCAAAGVPVIWLTGAQVLQLGRDVGAGEPRFGDDRCCGRCRARAARLKRGLCRACYDRFLARERGRFTHRCAHCQANFRDSSQDARYCSRACAVAGRTFAYPPLEEMVERVCASSKRALAAELGVRYNTLVAYLNAHACDEQRRRMAAAAVQKKITRARAQGGWPPLAELERAVAAHGKDEVAAQFEVTPGAVLARIRRERRRAGLPTRTRRATIVWPAREHVQALVDAHGWSAAARQLDVGATSVRRFLGVER